MDSVKRTGPGIDKVSNDIETQIRQLIHRSALVGEKYSKMNCPVSPHGGNLRNSIKASRVDENTAMVSTNVHYAIWQEIGTRYFEGRFYMQKGATAAKKYLKKELKQVKR